MRNISTVLDEKLKVTEIIVDGATLDEVKANIVILIESRLDDILRALEVVASKGNPRDIIAYNNALQVSKYTKLEMISKFTEQAEALWKFKQTFNEG